MRRLTASSEDWHEGGGRRLFHIAFLSHLKYRFAPTGLGYNGTACSCGTPPVINIVDLNSRLHTPSDMALRFAV